MTGLLIKIPQFEKFSPSRNIKNAPAPRRVAALHRTPYRRFGIFFYSEFFFMNHQLLFMINNQ